MNRKTILGAALLCALALCAFGAANASAAGYTAYTCTEVANGGYKDSHCREASPGSGTFGTTKIPLNTTTAGTSTQATTGVTTGANQVSILEGKIALSIIRIECKTVMSEEGWIENREVGGTMGVVGGGFTHYTECSLPSFAKCTVNSPAAAAGTIVTNKIKTETVAGGVKYQPNAGEVFVELVISGAECVPKGTFPVKGSVTGTIPAERHSHITFNKAGGLTMGVNAATYTGTTHGTMEGTTNTIGGQEGV